MNLCMFSFFPQPPPGFATLGQTLVALQGAQDEQAAAMFGRREPEGPEQEPELGSSSQLGNARAPQEVMIKEIYAEHNSVIDTVIDTGFVTDESEYQTRTPKEM